MATQISRKTAELMAKKLRAKLDALYADQESHPSKQPNQMMTSQKFGKGGIIPMYGGPYGSSTVGSTPSRQALLNQYQYDPESEMPSSMINPNTIPDFDYTKGWNQGNWEKGLLTQGSTAGKTANIPVSSIENWMTNPSAFAGSKNSMNRGIDQMMGINNPGNPGGLPQGHSSLPGSGVLAKNPDGSSQYGPGPEHTKFGLFSGNGDTDWAGIAGAVGSFAPGLYNLYNAFQKPEVENPKDYYNPQYNNAMSLMRNRRFDVRPLLEQNQMNQNTYNRNLRNTASSRGELLSNMGGGYANRLRSDSAAYTQKSQMDAGYRGEEAQMRAQLGQQRAQTNMQVGDWNARNRAAQRNYGAAAAGNIGDASSLLLRNRNMKSADAMRTEAMAAAFPYLKEWMPGLEETMKHLNTQKNGK